MMGTLLLLAVAAQSISLSAKGGALFFYLAAVIMGIAQAVLYPTLTTYLSFILPKTNRNVLMGLFRAMADLGVSMGGMIMGPIADITSYSVMYGICAALSLSLVLFAYGHRRIRAGLAS